MSTMDISNILLYQRRHNLYCWFYFNLFHLKVLIPPSKFSGTRKFTLRYQWFEMNFEFEVSYRELNIVETF